jgi:hypothetical protein
MSSRFSAAQRNSATALSKQSPRARDQPRQTSGSRQALHALKRGRDALAEPQLGCNVVIRRRRGSPPVDGLDPLQQPRVAQGAVRRRARASIVTLSSRS